MVSLSHGDYFTCSSTRAQQVYCHTSAVYYIHYKRNSASFLLEALENEYIAMSKSSSMALVTLAAGVAMGPCCL